MVELLTRSWTSCLVLILLCLICVGVAFMSNLQDMLRARITGGDQGSKPATTVYTGAHITKTIGDADQDEIEVLTDPKGQPIALYYAGQLLPYRLVKADPATVTRARDTYRRGVAGRILKLVLSVPKGA